MCTLTHVRGGWKNKPAARPSYPQDPTRGALYREKAEGRPPRPDGSVALVLGGELRESD